MVDSNILEGSVTIKDGTEKNMMEKIKNNPSFDLDEIPKKKSKKNNGKGD